MLFALAPGPLLVWFARITLGRSGDGKVERGRLYHELNVMRPGLDGTFFVPGIWATSRRSVRIGRRYGMPKGPIEMSFREADGVVESRAGLPARGAGPSADAATRAGGWEEAAGGRRPPTRRAHAHPARPAPRAIVRARLLPGGRPLGLLANALLPLRAPPVHFPSGLSLRAELLAAPALVPALVAGRLAVDEPWLPRPVPLLPLGLYAPGLLFGLPPTSRAKTEASPA